MNLEPLSLDFEAVMFELEPLPQIELPELEPYEIEPPKLDFQNELLDLSN